MTRSVPLRPPPSTGTSVIVPVAERPAPLDRIYAEFSGPVAARGPSEFVFVVEAWRRDLFQPLRGLVEDGAPIRLVEIEHSASEATLIEAGAAQATYPVLMVLPPYPRVTGEGVGQLIDVLHEDGLDLVTASRHPRRDPFWNRIQTKLLHRLLRHTVWVPFADIASGVRALRREVLADVPLYAEYARFLPVLAVRAGYRVREVEVPQHVEDQSLRLHGPGTYLRRVVDLVGLAFLVRFTRKPLRFFGLIGAALASAGSLVLVVMAAQRMAGRPLADRPLLLLGVLMVVLGTQSIGLGLIGELVVHFRATQTRGYRLAPDSPADGPTSSSDEMWTSEPRVG